MKQYEYQARQQYFAIVAGSLERHAALELQELGAEVTRELPRGLEFRCGRETLCRILYCARLCQRILAPLTNFACPSDKALYARSKEDIAWTGLFPLNTSFGIQCNVSASHIKHSLYAGQMLKDAICDSFREQTGQRPDFSTKNPSILFNLHIRNDRATISLDLTGVSMHKRGYRLAAGSAPLQETLAAALVRLSGWDGSKPLLDPMCGSGTLLAEALMAWCHIPAGFKRNDRGAEFLPDWDAALMRRVRGEENEKIRELPGGLIAGSDMNPRNLEIAGQNLASLPGGDRIGLDCSRFQDLPRLEGRFLLTNPPYGVRLEDEQSIRLLYNELGDFLKQRCPASESYILCGSKELVPELRLRAHWKKNLKNGDLEVVLAKIVVK